MICPLRTADNGHLCGIMCWAAPARFYAGPTVVLRFRERWYRRAWRRLVSALSRKPANVGSLTVAGVDQDNGIITLSAGGFPDDDYGQIGKGRW